MIAAQGRFSAADHIRSTISFKEFMECLQQAFCSTVSSRKGRVATVNTNLITHTTNSKGVQQ